MDQRRRDFLRTTTMAAASGILLPDNLFASPAAARPVRILVWDERQSKQKEAYENFLGNCIAGHLEKVPGFSVSSVCIDDPHQGLSEDVLDNIDVLIWWGHQRHAEISTERARTVVDRIISGRLSLIALHSAHWSTPFMEAMNEISLRKVLEDKTIRKEAVTLVKPVKQYTFPAIDTRITPYSVESRFPDGRKQVALHLPYCCFPAYRTDGKPSTLRVLKREHPIFKGIPESFELPQTEMYCEPFHVPEPDEVLMEENWEPGEWFRSAMLWKLGKGKLFYFRPGHETYPIFKQKWPMDILTNAARWLAS